MTVTAGGTVSGLQFGNFQDITVSGEVFNDLNGNGTLDPGDPGLPGWTVDLLRLRRRLVATTVTDANGDYSFTDLGPGTYTVAGRAAARLGADRPGASGHLHGHGDQRSRRHRALLRRLRARDLSPARSTTT